MIPSALRVEATRGDLVESVHRVAAAVVDVDGRLLAAADDPDVVTWWRSAAKPFQALPLVLDGAADRFHLPPDELAFACASHSSEPHHIEVASRFMARIGVADSDLACGLHTPLSPEVARAVVRGTARMTSRWSNCSGKHTGMLALAKHHGWPLAGYNSAGHPVQQRILEELARWTGIQPSKLFQAVDGCAAVCFGLPLRAMALAYARLGVAAEAGPQRVTAAMMSHPWLIAGTGRLCTELMAAWPGRVIAKIGAEGIYSAALPQLGWGVALKVEDGDMRSSGIALLEVLKQALARLAPQAAADFPEGTLAGQARQPILNTRGTETGEVRPAGVLRFFDA